MSYGSDVLHGAQLPRIRTVPTATRSDGEDAAYLSGSYGLRPDEWQENVLDGWLGRRADGKWSSPRCGLAVPRQNGKNGVLEMRELFGMVALGEKFLHTAHEVKTARKAFIRLAGFFENTREHPELAALVKEIRRTNGQEAIVLSNGGSVEFVARSKGSGRGYTVDCLVMDEAQELSEDALAALLPTISASPTRNPQQIMTGTPPGPTAVGEVFTRVRTAGVGGVDHRLCWHEWSVEMPVDLDDRRLWSATNPALGFRLGWETVADERAAFDDETFARERLGAWSKTLTGGAVDYARWCDLADPDADRGTDVVFGVDVDEARRVSIGVAWVRPDEALQVMVADHGLPTGGAVDRLVALHESWGGSVVVGGPADVLEADLVAAGVPVVVLKPAEFAQACGSVADRVSAGTIRHGNQAVLNDAVKGARWRSVGTAGERAWQLKDAGGIGPLAAVTRAVHGVSVAVGPAPWAVWA